MKDAFGGAFMIKVFLVFIIVYVFFTAIALNYAKAFKVKNLVIEYLEEEEVNDISLGSEYNNLKSYIEKYINGEMNYHAEICNDGYVSTPPGKVVYCINNGIRIEEMASAKNTEGIYYKVTTGFNWDLGFLSVLTQLNGNTAVNDSSVGTWLISGETRLIVNE